jgi:hypothetical protein
VAPVVATWASAPAVMATAWAVASNLVLVDQAYRIIQFFWDQRWLFQGKYTSLFMSKSILSFFVL